jgi:hypothetical protein
MVPCECVSTLLVLWTNVKGGDQSGAANLMFSAIRRWRGGQ